MAVKRPAEHCYRRPARSYGCSSAALHAPGGAGGNESGLPCARQGRTVVTTIHQPNGSITRCFDDLLLLTKGVLVYSGPWADAVGYFDALGFKCA